MKILIADDEVALAKFLKKGLSSEGFQCEMVNQLGDILPQLSYFMPDVLILDRKFGQQDSIQLVEDIKRHKHSPMLMMLTAVDEVSERVKGLQQGADDYLCKPFDFDELLARVTALGRRSTSSHDQQAVALRLGTLEIIQDERIVTLDGEEVPLTKIEYDLLHYMAQNSNKVLSRERILGRVWQTFSDPQTNIIDVYISKLRKKLDSDPAITIQTLRGNGYRLNAQDGH